MNESGGILQWCASEWRNVWWVKDSFCALEKSKQSLENPDLNLAKSLKREKVSVHLIGKSVQTFSFSSCDPPFQYRSEYNFHTSGLFVTLTDQTDHSSYMMISLFLNNFISAVVEV